MRTVKSFNAFRKIQSERPQRQKSDRVVRARRFRDQREPEAKEVGVCRENDDDDETRDTDGR